MTIDVLTPEHRAELRQKLGDRQFDGTGHVELLTDDVSGLAVLGLTLGCTDGSRITAVVDHGPVIEHMRKQIAIAERKLHDDDDEDDE